MSLLMFLLYFSFIFDSKIASWPMSYAKKMFAAKMLMTKMLVAKMFMGKYVEPWRGVAEVGKAPPGN